jgi:pimeloyl-ACP methyl ester carboxylesterase
MRKSLAALLGTIVGGVAWMRAMEHRNRRLVRPPMLDSRGRPYPTDLLELSDGERVLYVDAGEGPPLLLIPGADGMKETWRYQLPALEDRYRVITADLRSRFPIGSDFDQFADDAVQLLDHLGVDSPVVIGQSLGGAIAMRLASLHPERVRALVLANTLARISYEHVGLNATLLAPVAAVANRYLPTRAARRLGRVWSEHDVWIYDSSPGWERVVDYALWTGSRTEPSHISGHRVRLLRGEDLRPELPGIEVPALVLKGPRDTYTPAAWAVEIAERIPGAKYVEVDDTGHCSHISMPADFNRELLLWLDALETGALEDGA